MSKWQEDILYEITMCVQALGLKTEFNKQMKKMNSQAHHKYKTIGEKYEYAYSKIMKDK